MAVPLPPSLPTLLVAVTCAAVADALARAARRARGREVRHAAEGRVPDGGSPAEALRRAAAATVRWGAARPRATAAGAALIGAVLGVALGGPPVSLAAAVAAARVPKAVRRRRARRRSELLERQLADLAAATASAVRSGLSVVQALDFASSETAEPLSGLLTSAAARRAAGASFDLALEGFGQAVGSEDARLFVLVLAINRRSGGNVAPALESVAATIRDRVAARRELRALTAQGRISGVVLGALPVGFFLVLALTSRGELAPVLRSGAGAAMVATGLALEGIAYVWIRHLLRVVA